MEMMNADVALALRTKWISWANPKDYLTFFCLGSREVRKGPEYMPEERPNTDYSRAQQARRFMIYVHVKMMVGNQSTSSKTFTL